MQPEKARVEQETVLSPPEIGARYDDFTELLIQAREKIFDRAGIQRAQVDAQTMTSPGDVGDASVVDENADYYLSLADSDRATLLLIRDAFLKMRKRTYGLCETCGGAIEIGRLEKLPYARMCLDCQSGLEAKQATAYPRSTKL